MTPFRKCFASSGAAQSALRRTERLRAAGIHTPDARIGDTARELVFDRIDGIGRFELLEAAPITALLSPLADLHDLPAEALPRFDPLLRIRPRLSAGAPSWLAAAVNAPGAGQSGCAALLHGDFHVGQLIRDLGGTMWLIDLDDLARGEPEADLGNFIAHLATSPEAARGGFGESLAFWRREVLRGWSALGRGCDMGLLDLYLPLALIRRHLKLRETGRLDYAKALEPYLSPP